MERLLLAFFNSMRALGHLARYEKAVQQELGLLVVSVPAAFCLSPSIPGALVLIGSILFLIMVEVLNTGIEATCDAISREFNVDIQLAKDCGSLAVLISITLVSGLWLYALVERFAS